MAKIDVSLERASLLSDLITVQLLPSEILQQIKHHQSHQILDAVASAAILPQLTGRIFVHFEGIFPDICARWLNSSRAAGSFDTREIISAFGRILAFTPYLSTFLDGYLHHLVHSHAGGESDAVDQHVNLDPLKYDTAGLLQVLLALWRLNSFDRRRYARLSRPSQIQDLFHHDSPAIRYLAVRVFCQLHDAADAKLETLLKTHIQKTDSLFADFDGTSVDFTFLSLHEHARVEEIHALRTRAHRDAVDFNDGPVSLQELTPYVLRYGRAVLPCPLGPLSTQSSLIHTPTTTDNLENLALLMRTGKPILLHGLSGSGKTSLVREVARELGKEDSMVTLHLNEQTDAKVLIGLYATGSKPGSFQWRPGVLTTAVKEGRWVLIEDLDRAPTEVMSTLLPLIERGELLLPSRGERIQAADGFRVFATIRTSLGMNDKESLPNLIGIRLWQLLPVKTLPQEDMEQIIRGTHPRLHHYTAEILSVFNKLLSTTTGANRLALGRGAGERPISTRDLLKWCRRLDTVLDMAGCISGGEPVSDTTRDRMFMEAIECFIGSIKEPSMQQALVSNIANEMYLSADRVDHYMQSYAPDFQDLESRLVIGRVQFNKRKRSSRVTKSRRPFASTRHAKRLLEQIAVAVKQREPVLLVGETGIGKTTVVQQLADSLGHKLVAINLSQQSEVGDLLGGFKPISSRSLAMPLKEEFEDLFEKTGVSADKNKDYLERINKKFARGKWTEVAKEWRKAPKMFNSIVSTVQKEQKPTPDTEGHPAKRRKTESSKLQRLLKLKPRWDAFSQSLDQFDRQISTSAGSFAFSFVEGNIVKAARNGDWVLLDEINLASPDTLESIADLLQSGPTDNPSILLSETGEIERIVAHPDFRIFGAMNPATDVGKRDLPLGLRSRFTEIYVHSPDKDKKDLIIVIKTYLSGNNSSIDRLADRVADLYLKVKQLADSKVIVDGANEVPHFSLRTLARVLTYANDVSPIYGLQRALYEGFCMGFLTLLSQDSEGTVLPMIREHLLKPADILSVPPKPPADKEAFVSFTMEAQVSSGKKRKDDQYWILRGSQPLLDREDYIRTPYVQRNLINLVRASSTRRYPILIQGPTSAGKTSMVEYLANVSGNKFVRINNHEHTDLQEYLGTYVSGSDGKLKFQEGLLVQAMREGSWIVLDELNLAPTDVLEALNRLLDDNRELLIPETQEIVRPHESFMLFATQNPPGLYAGRKILSRAFRNRFLELHFDDIPEQELQTILEKRSRNMAPSDCQRIVKVYKNLTRLRQESRVFEQKNSFATLRDLFRWSLRKADTRQEIAENGFMLLAERVRKAEEREAVKEIIDGVFKVKIDPDQLYGDGALPEFSKGNDQGVIWAKAMRRLYVLLRHAVQNNEPVLLVGETGCGKTTACQLLAEADGTDLHIVNAHQNTETGDLIGSQRPVRNRGALVATLEQDLGQALVLLGRSKDESLQTVGQLQAWYHNLKPEELETLPDSLKKRISSTEGRSKALFEWQDGSLVHAMKTGQFFLLDEISLADDSVLERLNSVLEPQRSLLLAEKGIDDSFVEAVEGFQFFATMNPGGDFGKKELSPALRNRFTEIWVPPFSEPGEVYDIVLSKLDDRFKKERLKTANGQRKSVASAIVEFAAWYGQTFRPPSAPIFSLRDILAWVEFMNKCPAYSTHFALLHGAATVYIDTIGANPSALLAVDPRTMEGQREVCIKKLGDLCGRDLSTEYQKVPQIKTEGGRLWIGDFSMNISSVDVVAGDEFRAPTTKLNAMRMMRALQITKPVLLEGNPGVGKTTLVGALARACGRPLTRINLSDQTDLMDLFGTDVPVEGAEAGNFAWKDAPFLQAMQKGEWVLLDEMNLASQSVLEGLNACLDHRGEVYISELDQVFKRHGDFRLFAAQNPHHQGGGRKGLPSSFVNRFTVVYADVFTTQDLMVIASGSRFDKISPEIREHMIDFISKLDHAVVADRAFGAQGSPWEFNLRDTLRWLDLMSSPDPLMATALPDDFFDIVIRQRFRTPRDRDAVTRFFAGSFNHVPSQHSLYHDMDRSISQVGLALLRRNPVTQETSFPCIETVSRLSEVESVMIAVKQNLPCILVGPSGSGKSTLLQHVAALAGKALVVFPLNADVDTMDLIGGFEQVDPHREIHAGMTQLRKHLQIYILNTAPNAVPTDLLNLYGDLAFQDGNLNLQVVASHIDALASQSLPDGLKTLLSSLRELLGKSLTLENPRFEWLDGVIVKAIEDGEWLVLDNANLCSASVLDRLNSLLERPDGFLSINEHSGPGGEPRIIKPHQDFRIFLTVDPRYGELSRAMRNRSIEIYLDDQVPKVQPFLERIAPVEAALQRFYLGIKAVRGPDGEFESNMDLRSLSFDMLSLEDAGLLSKFDEAVKVDPKLARTATAEGGNWVSQSLLRYVQSKQADPLRKAIYALYQPTPDSLSMPLHPLTNAPMVRLIEKSHQGLAHWLAACYEFFVELQDVEATMNLQLAGANATKPSKLNRLQRSYISDKVATVSKDSTVNGVKFLVSTLQGIGAYLMEHLESHGNWRQGRSMVRALITYWKRTFRSLCAASFEEARFQAHLIQGSDLLRGIAPTVQSKDNGALMEGALACLETSFSVGFQLRTGLSMEILWLGLRPDPIQDLQSLQQIVELERLAERFDTLKWRAGAKTSDLNAIMAAMGRVYSIVRANSRNAADLVRDLQNELSSLESTVGEEAKDHLPIFATAFESLRQVCVLHEISGTGTCVHPDTDSVVLSNLPTIARMRVGAFSPSAFQSVDYLLAQETKVHPWTDTVSSSLVATFGKLSSASLQELQSLENELPIMGKTFMRATEPITTDPLLALNRLLLNMVSDIMGSHDEALKSETLKLYQQILDHTPWQAPEIAKDVEWLSRAESIAISGSSVSLHLGEIFANHFSKCLLAMGAVQQGLHPRSTYSSIAWVQFAIGCIKLYVPNKVFDPYLRAQVEMEFHEELADGLKQQIASLATFEARFTGQDTNLRHQLLTDELNDLGERASIQTVYRPGDDELTRLQGEFSNVLNSLVQNDIASTHFRYVSGLSGEPEELKLIQENVKRLIERFWARFSAYQDLTVPLVNFLRCLQVGLSLGTPAGQSRAEDEDNIMALLQAAPFLNGVTWRVDYREMPVRTFEFLGLVQAAAAVEGLHRLSDSLRGALFNSLASFHEEWSKKLDADRKEEETRQSLYRYKGSFEDEEEFDAEEFDQLFPSYTNEDGEFKPRPKQHAARDLSVLLAEAHEKIFVSRGHALDLLQGICKQIGRKFADQSADASEVQIRRDKALLPPAMLLWEERAQAFASTGQPSNYNFYEDPNLFESRKLLVLVQEIRTRFQQLRRVDEISHHQTLTDVIAACDQVLEMAVNEPLAKIIIGVERLHALVYEWQEGGWASRVHKATALFEKLQDTICDWRRLELSSWSRLFDMEEKKCRDDAKSWWFIAYGAVILEPWARVQQGQEDLKNHATHLLSVLESYFSDTIMGQFVARLGLLRQLKLQLDFLVLDVKPLATIRDALQNFILYYQRYEPKVLEAIRTSRAPLDRSMKDVLLMFKWNDKNIDALRESARKSHQKLFRLVRKFRDVLGRPMKPIIVQGLPEEKFPEGVAVRKSDMSSPHIEPDAISLSQQLVPGIIGHVQWERFSNPNLILKAMSRHGSLSNSTIQAAELVNSYISDLQSSMTALRKETPSSLTEENKEQVQHLKARKVNLLAETLKTLRQMGFSRGLGSTVLDRQKSTALILVGSGLLENKLGADVTRFLEYFYHKTLDLAPGFRQAAIGHSEDLNRESVNRSVGFLEGILNEMVGQRQFLSQVAEAKSAVEEAIGSIAGLSAREDERIITVQKCQTNHGQVLAWIIPILQFGLHLVSIHAKFGHLDNDHCLRKLENHATAFISLKERQDSASELPTGFSSSEHDQIQVLIDNELEALHENLEVLGASRSDLAFVMEQIQLWIKVQTAATESDAPRAGIEQLTEATMTTFSKVLVAIQRFRETAQTLPDSSEDMSWLMKYNDGLQKSIKSLRMHELCDSIHGITRAVKELDLENPVIRNAATALCRAVLPVLQQYSDICNRNMVEFAGFHGEICRLGHHLSKSFIQLASEGFCSPKEKADEKSGESGELESGTGLGDGEGAEDISKDIQPDEDLSELAQDADNNAGDVEVEDQKDAVDMGQDELEGDLGSVQGEEDDESGSQSGKDEEGDEDMDDEAGNVDDLDPTAVDEKMWDGQDEDEAAKDQQGDQSKGQQKEDEQVAADDQQKQDDQVPQPEKNGEQGNADENADAEEEEEANEDEGQDEAEGLPQEELNKQDQNVQQNETLAFPDDMDIDMDDQESSPSDNDLDNLSTMDEPEVQDAQDNESLSDGDRQDQPLEEEPGQEDENPEQEEDGELNSVTEDPVDTDVDADEESFQGHDDEEEKREPPLEDSTANQDDAAPSDLKTGGGLAETEKENPDNENFQSNAAQQDQEALGEEPADKGKTTGGKNSLAKSNQEGGQGQDDTEEKTDSQPFKKLGDALERWYRSQKDIQDASSDQENGQQNKENADSDDLGRAEFQHLHDENAPADTQALGTATDEEARPMDDAMAIDTETDETQNQVRPDESELEDKEQPDVEMEGVEPGVHQDKSKADAEDPRTGVSTRQGAFDVEDDPMSEDEHVPQELDDEEVEETSTQLSSTHLTAPEKSLRDFSESAELWTAFQTKTHALSLSLTSQLRLVLTPTQATKLSGSYRTGKRLNIKKIIPYIASSYKRDKIWMRRAVPSKRAYQVLLCVDDSSSMGGGDYACGKGNQSNESETDGSRGNLALESLVMVSRALAMLEVGQVGVLGFGDDLFVAHDFSSAASAAPFGTSPEAGARVLQQFTFAQRGTDMVRLLRGLLDHFARARLQQAAGGAEDLWQLALVLSDGMVQSSTHARLRPLLREALEQRVMVVFVVLDGARAGGGSGVGAAAAGGPSGSKKSQQKSDSVLDLQEAKFTADGEIVIERYLDSFPFQYYLIMHHLEDLPGALAGLLRTWFAEVNS